MNKLDKFTEYETKYKVDSGLIYKFKAILSELDFKKHINVDSPDFYYTKPDGSFIRYRKSVNEKRAEITLKEKVVNSKNNIQRKEVNWRVDGTSREAIEEGIKMMGYEFNFSIWKSCDIYNFKDATVVFYTVKCEKNTINSFVEIELNEHTIHKLTNDQAMNVIRKYESLLSPLGITYRNRLNKSLFEMYVNKNLLNNVVNEPLAMIQ